MIKCKYIPLSLAGLLLAFIPNVAACNSSSGQAVGPFISSLTAEHTVVYPLGNTRVTCIASDQAGGSLTYQWVCNEGTVIGSGKTITWEAPKTYGDFHIMCTVYDSIGNKTSQTTTVTVIVRDPTKCCR